MGGEAANEVFICASDAVAEEVTSAAYVAGWRPIALFVAPTWVPWQATCLIFQPVRVLVAVGGVVGTSPRTTIRPKSANH